MIRQVDLPEGSNLAGTDDFLLHQATREKSPLRDGSHKLQRHKSHLPCSLPLEPIFFYRILNGLYPSYLNDIITVDELQQLRCKARLLVPRFSIVRYGKKSISCLSPVLWNTLNNDIKQCNVVTAFKKRVQLWNGPTCKRGFCAQCRISNPQFRGCIFPKFEVASPPNSR